MTITALINRTCTLVRRSPADTTDDYGNEDETATSVSTVCELQQTMRSEPGDQGETSDTTWTLFLPASQAVHTGDQIIVDGETYDVTGEPWRARNPRTQEVSHIEATVRRTAGADDEVGS